MKALILNSGMGKRMGSLTAEHPKCMTQISKSDTILSRQLKLLLDAGIQEVVITTGFANQLLMDYCNSLCLNLNYTFVYNPDYNKTNYIYSIFLAKDYLNDDILLLHGDLVFEDNLPSRMINNQKSCMVISTTLPLPKKDFKAVISDTLVLKVGIEFFDQAFAAQPFYKLLKKDWQVWLSNICAFCDVGIVTCYAENALNVVAKQCNIEYLDIRDALCDEIDTLEDLQRVKEKVRKLQ